VNLSGRKLWKPTNQRRRQSLRSHNQQKHPLRRPPTAAEDTQRRTDAVATWHLGQPIAAVGMYHDRLTVVVAMLRRRPTDADAMLLRPHTAADAMLHRPHTAADAMLHRPHTAADAMLHRPPSAVDAMLHHGRHPAVDAMLHHGRHPAADVMLHRQGSARRPRATVAALPREACAVAAVAAALMVGARAAGIPHAEAAKPGIATTTEGHVGQR